MSLRRLRPSDAAAYRALMLTAYATAPEAFTSTASERETQTLAWWEARVSNAPEADQAIWGALEEGRLVGVAGIRFERREKTRHKAHLFGMYVAPECRGQGFGRKLVAAVLRHAQEADVRVLQLTVREPNLGAQRLYASCGFEPFGVEPLAVRSGKRFVSTVHMWRPVDSA